MAIAGIRLVTAGTLVIAALQSACDQSVPLAADPLPAGNIALPGSNPRVLASGQSHPVELSVDEDYVYWVNVGSDGVANVADAPDGAVMRAAKAGGDVKTLAAAQGYPERILID